MKTGAFAAVLAAAWLNTSGIAAAAPVKTDSGLVEGAARKASRHSFRGATGR